MARQVGADDDGDRHRFAFGHIALEQHLAQVTGRPRKTGQQALVMDHEPVGAPVHPIGLGVLGDDQIPGAQIAAAVALVHHGHRQVEQIDLVARNDDVLARRVVDHDRRDHLVLALGVDLVELPQRRIHRQAERHRDAAPGGDRIGDDAELRAVILDIAEQERRPVALARQPADPGQLLIPIDLVVDGAQVAGRVDGAEEAPEILVGHVRLV